MKYDCAVSVGQWCATAMYLRRYGLRSFSGPFDWFLAHHVPFGVYADLICNGFKGFMTAESVAPDPDKDDRYVERTSSMVSMHDFKKDVPFAEQLPSVVEKFRRRIVRFNAAMAQSRSVLLVRCVQERMSDREDLKSGLNRLRAHFPGKTIDLVVLQHDALAEGLVREELAPGLVMYRARFFDLNGTPVLGDQKLCGKVFRTFRVRGQLRNLIRGKIERLRKKLC